jgi:hypothetical protein
VPTCGHRRALGNPAPLKRVVQLWHEDQRLSVEPLKVHYGTRKAFCAEIEGHDVVLPYAVQPTVRPEPQSPRPAESGGAFGCEDAHELPGQRAVFTYARHSVGSAEWPFAGDDDVPVGCELQIKGITRIVGLRRMVR